MGLPGVGHTCQERLVYIDNLPDRRILSHDALPQVLFQRFAFRPHFGGVQQHLESGHFRSPSPSTYTYARKRTGDSCVM